MKKTLKAALLFALMMAFSISLAAQTELTGALGLTFGMNAGTVKSKNMIKVFNLIYLLRFQFFS